MFCSNDVAKMQEQGFQVDIEPTMGCTVVSYAHKFAYIKDGTIYQAKEFDDAAKDAIEGTPLKYGVIVAQHYKELMPFHFIDGLLMLKLQKGLKDLFDLHSARELMLEMMEQKEDTIKEMMQQFAPGVPTVTNVERN